MTQCSDQRAAAEADARNLAILAGRNPGKKICATIARHLQIFTYRIVEAAVMGEPNDWDALDHIASGPREAAELFQAARQGALTADLERFVLDFIGTIGFKYPPRGLPPEDAAIALLDALDNAVAEARRMKSAFTQGPQD